MGTTTELETSIQETFTSPRKYAANGTHQRHMTWMEAGMLSLWGNGFWPDEAEHWKILKSDLREMLLGDTVHCKSSSVTVLMKIL